MIRPIRDYTTHSLCVLYLCRASPEEFLLSFYSEHNEPVLQTAALKTAAFSQVNYLKACRHWSLITDCDLGILVVLSIFFIIHWSVRKGERIRVYAICFSTVYTPVCHLPFPAGHAGSGMQLLEYANQIVLIITLSFLRHLWSRPNSISSESFRNSSRT